MIDGVFLSEAINIEDFQKGKINLIQTNCGSGKTYFAINELSKQVDNLSKIVYLIDSAAMRDSLAKEPTCKVYQPSDRHILDGSIINFCKEDKIIVMTYHKMGFLLKYHPNAFDNVEIIICDEIHKIPEFIEIDRRKNKKNFPLATKEEQDYWTTCSCSCYLAAQYLKEFAEGVRRDALGKIEIVEQKLVVALSATPQKAYDFFKNTFHEIKINAQLVAYETFNTIFYGNLHTAIKSIPKGSKALLYVPYIKEMSTCIELAKSLGFTAEGIWSLSNEDHKMSNAQKELRTYILEKQELPADYDLVFINQAYETAINIRGDINYMVIHTTDTDKRTQVRNRYRNDLEIQFILAGDKDKNFIRVPEEYLGVWLNTEKKKELCGVMGFKNSKRVVVGWTTTKIRLEELGYKIEDGVVTLNKKRTRVSRIEKGENIK